MKRKIQKSQERNQEEDRVSQLITKMQLTVRDVGSLYNLVKSADEPNHERFINKLDEVKVLVEEIKWHVKYSKMEQV